MRKIVVVAAALCAALVGCALFADDDFGPEGEGFDCRLDVRCPSGPLGYRGCANPPHCTRGYLCGCSCISGSDTCHVADVPYSSDTTTFPFCSRGGTPTEASECAEYCGFYRGDCPDVICDCSCESSGVCY